MVAIFSTLGILAGQLLPAPVLAQNDATMYFSPSKGSFSIGQNFTVGVYVSSPSQAMNAAQGVIRLPTDKLEIVGVSKDGSKMNLWVQEPGYTDGSIHFEGVVLNPGYTGTGGKIINITFRVKGAGTASLSFVSGSVLANDGQGTNILSGLGSASYTLGGEPTPAPTPTPAPKPTPASVPGAPSVSSPTHPDSKKWYPTNDATFEWPLPTGVTGVNFFGDRNPTTNPGEKSDGLFRSYTFNDVEEGTWYFHIRFKNSLGWGAISHFKFLIDTQKPEKFDIEIGAVTDPTEPRRTLLFNATDVTSGIDHYEIVIDGGTSETWLDDGSHKYQTPPLTVGDHTILVKALDKAGNYAEKFVTVTVRGLEAPSFTEYPRELKAGEKLTAPGSTYPNSKVTIWLQRGEENQVSQIVQSDSRGRFIFVSADTRTVGDYTLQAAVEDSRGIKSGDSEKINIRVYAGGGLGTLGGLFKILSIVTPLVLLVVIIFLLRKRRKKKKGEGRYHRGERNKKS